MTDEKTDEPLTERAYVTLTRELIKVLDGEWSKPVRLRVVRAEGLELFLEIDHAEDMR